MKHLTLSLALAASALGGVAIAQTTNTSLTGDTTLSSSLSSTLSSDLDSTLSSDIGNTLSSDLGNTLSSDLDTDADTDVDTDTDIDTGTSVDLDPADTDSSGVRGPDFRTGAGNATAADAQSTVGNGKSKSRFNVDNTLSADIE